MRSRSAVDPVQVFDTYGGRLYAGAPKKIADADGRTREQWFTVLGMGSLNLPAVVAKMKKHGYKGWIVTELDVYDRPLFSEKEGVTKNFKNCREKLGCSHACL